MNKDQIASSFSTSTVPLCPDLARLHAREGFLRASLYDWPPFQFPGYKKAPSPKFRNESELLQYLLTRTAEITAPPLHSAESFRENEEIRIPATIADIATDLTYGLECMARRGNDTASRALHELAESSIFMVGRELKRGNKWLAQKIKHAIRWPAFLAKNSSLREQALERLKEYGFGEKLAGKVHRAALADPAHQLVNDLFHYMHDTRQRIEAIESEITVGELDQTKVSPVLPVIWDLPLDLNEETFDAWHKAGLEVMKLTTGHENYWRHPAFKRLPLSPLNPKHGPATNSERAIREAWKKRARQD